VRSELREQIIAEPAFADMPARLSLAAVDGDILAHTDRWIIATVPLSEMYLGDLPAGLRDQSRAVRIFWQAEYPATEDDRVIKARTGVTRCTGAAGDPAVLRRLLVEQGSAAALDYLQELHRQIFEEPAGTDLVEELGGGWRIIREWRPEAAAMPVATEGVAHG
jgi:hypothetical protein